MTAEHADTGRLDAALQVINEMVPAARADIAMRILLSAVQEFIVSCNAPVRNVDVGRALGIYDGHKGHEGHVSRTILAQLEAEGAVTQLDDKCWIATRQLLSRESPPSFLDV